MLLVGAFYNKINFTTTQKYAREDLFKILVYRKKLSHACINHFILLSIRIYFQMFLPFPLSLTNTRAKWRKLCCTKVYFSSFIVDKFWLKHTAVQHDRKKIKAGEKWFFVWFASVKAISHKKIQRNWKKEQFPSIVKI